MGTLKMIDWCREFDCPAPEWKEQAGSVYVTFHPAPWFKKEKPSGPAKVESGVESQVESGVGCMVGSTIARTLDLLANGPLSKSQIARGLGKAAVSGQIHALVNGLLGNGWIERTIPEKPQSRLQRYRLTDQGRGVLRKLKTGDQNQ